MRKMSSRTKSPRNLEDLDQEIRQLRKKARQLEVQIDDRLKYLQENSGSLFIRSLLPRRIEGQEITGNPVLDRFLQNERFQKVLIRLADLLAEKVGEGLNWLVDRVLRK
jgi:hypothetical protein